MERNERSSPSPASWQFCCIISGSAARHMSRSTIRGNGGWQRHSSGKLAWHHEQTPSSGDCVLEAGPTPSQMEREAEQQMAAPTVPRTPNVHRAHEALTKSADGRVTTAQARHGSGEEQFGKGAYPCLPSPGAPCYGWLRWPSRLTMNSLRSALTAASPAKRNRISGRRKKNRYELTQSQMT